MSTSHHRALDLRRLWTSLQREHAGGNRRYSSRGPRLLKALRPPGEPEATGLAALGQACVHVETRVKRQVRSIRLYAQPALLGTVCLLAAACAGDGHPPAEPLFSGNPADFTWTLPTGWTPPSVPADNPMSPAKVELGRRLFYDTRLSGNGGFSCASCHRQEFGFADARNIPVGSTGEPHPRNSMGIANSAWLTLFNWADPLTPSLEQQALVPMFGDRPVELGLKGQEAALLDRIRAVSLYRTLFAASFAGQPDPVTVPNLTRALAAFERTVIAIDSPYDRAQRGQAGAMSAAAVRGEQLFSSAELACAQCHPAPFFTTAAELVGTGGATGTTFANNGLYNVGGDGSYPTGNRGLIDRTGQPDDMGKFRVPSLRNLAFTFPYMHDGSISTLDEVVEHYARGGRVIVTGPNAGDGRLSPRKDPRIRAHTLTTQDKGDLVAFLRSLSDSALVTAPRFANPGPTR
ncbi:MAG: di-heme enzyme [Gemmatimonadetes bacterium]|nr:di-heme enzyme [Gemmatimonadota bacterium]